MQHRHHYMYWIAAYLLLPAVAAQNAGPGQGNWTRGKPEAHGLLTSTIIQTARALVRWSAATQLAVPSAGGTTGASVVISSSGCHPASRLQQPFRVQSHLTAAAGFFRTWRPR